MIYCKELDKKFENQENLFKALAENSKDIIALKKSEVLKSVDKGTSVYAKPLDASKINLDANKSISLDDNHYYLAINSTYILDSHKDLHVNGIWNKTAKEQSGKNYLVDSHVKSLSTTIARKENVEIFVADVPFSAIGKNYTGNTQVLVYKIPKNKIIHQVAKDWLESGDDIEASVAMRYVNIELAMNSDSPDHLEQKKMFDEYHSLIANKNDFENDITYFWVVKEAKNIGEGSLVLFGSNNATGEIKNIEPSQDTQEHVEAEKSLQNIKNYLLNI